MVARFMYINILWSAIRTVGVIAFLNNIQERKSSKNNICAVSDIEIYCSFPEST
jgi:hypothetical protein